MVKSRLCRTKRAINEDRKHLVVGTMTFKWLNSCLLFLLLRASYILTSGTGVCKNFTRLIKKFRKFLKYFNYFLNGFCRVKFELKWLQGMYFFLPIQAERGPLSSINSKRISTNFSYTSKIKSVFENGKISQFTGQFNSNNF